MNRTPASRPSPLSHRHLSPQPGGTFLKNSMACSFVNHKPSMSFQRSRSEGDSGGLNFRLEVPMELVFTSEICRFQAPPHTPSTTARIARECQGLGVTRIVGSLAHSLWPHHVVVCVCPCCPWQCTTMPGPLGGGTTKRGDVNPKTIRVSSFWRPVTLSAPAAQGR